MSKAQELTDEFVRYCPECGLIGPVTTGSTCCPDSFGMNVRRWQAEKMERMLDRLRGEIVRASTTAKHDPLLGFNRDELVDVRNDLSISGWGWAAGKAHEFISAALSSSGGTES